MEVVETDLGEYIIQLAEETPFHIIAPAMHKTRRQVSSLFEENGVASGLTDIEDMARAAREALRGKLLTADMGITGANFLVAETGTVVIVTNEGNGRFCTSAPRIHVALTGMEKVVPSLDDLPVFLRLLPRAATGQRLTSYVSMISGPRRSSDEDGPDEFHLVIVDNGRSRLLADPDSEGVTVLHTLRGMPKRLPCIPEGGWPRLWMGLSRPHWSSDFSRPDRVQVRHGPPLCIESVRRLSGSMPRQDQPAQDAAAPTGQGVHAGSSAPRIPVGTSHSQRVHTNHEAPATVFIGGASHAAGPVSLFQRRQDKEHPCAASVQVDQVPGPARVQAQVFP